MGKHYPNGSISYPLADLHIYHELVPTPKSVFFHDNIIQQETQSQNPGWLLLSLLGFGSDMLLIGPCFEGCSHDYGAIL